MMQIMCVCKSILYLHPTHATHLGTSLTPTREITIHECMETRTVVGNEQMSEFVDNCVLDAPFRQEQKALTFIYDYHRIFCDNILLALCVAALS